MSGKIGRSNELESICCEVLRTASPTFEKADVVASFYPYIGLTHTIRRKGRAWIVRVSDHCQNAPPLVLEAIVTLLACKVLRRRPPGGMMEIYDAFRKDPGVESAVSARRRQRGRKRIHSLAGTHHSLEQISREINRRYFHDQLEIRKIGWGWRTSWSRLGHYDPVHQTITISPALDSPEVPRSVLSYLVYHEMLHAFFENLQTCRAGRRHTAEFRRAESTFPEYSESKKFLKAFCRSSPGKLRKTDRIRGFRSTAPG